MRRQQMFTKTINKFSTKCKPVYSTKEYVDLYINNSKDVINMQNKVLFSSVALLAAAIGWSINNNDKRFEQVDKRFEQVDKRFEQVDKRFEHLEKDVGELKQDVSEIKSILKEMNSRRSWF